MNGYFLSTPFIRYDPNLKPGNNSDMEIRAKIDLFDIFRDNDGKKSEKAFDIDIKRFFILVAAAGQNTLIISDTGTGKTSFVKGFLGSIFGEDFATIQVDPTLGPDTIRDINFGKIKSGGMLSEAVIPGPALTKPAVLIDEIDRAPAVSLNFLQNYFENGTVILEGNRTEFPGIKIKQAKTQQSSAGNLDGFETYQIKIATANIGPDYTGTFSMDRASLDRFPVIVDLDLYSMSSEDSAMFLEGNRYMPNHSDIGTAAEARELLFNLHDKIKDVKLSQTLEAFLIYLGNLNNCYVSPEGTKARIENFSPQDTCTGCHASATSKSICGNVYAPSNRTKKNLEMMTKAFAAYRKFRNPESEDTATIKDLFYVAPFVLTHKLDINKEWVSKYASESTSYAGEVMLHEIYERWISGIRENAELLSKYASGGVLTHDESAQLVKAILKDPWIVGRATNADVSGALRVATGGKKDPLKIS